MKMYNKKGLVLDEMIVSRYDKEELNNLLKDLGLTYVPGLTWDDRDADHKFFNPSKVAEAEKNNTDDVKTDL